MPSGPDDKSDSGSPSAQAPDHQLIRRIGRGAYGEVWLAKSVLGSYRAIKIVYRDHFENERPYEREFNGIRAYEPLSRAHPSLLDVLHVGTDAESRYFYYVMELGDDVARGRDIDPGSYRPKTLAEEVRRLRRLPVEECLKIGVELCEALDAIHKAGMVHRDVKPSNIIFVNGRPKLADVGLMADISEATTVLGTPGYISPEGPGRPTADIYALGKVLYEAATGRGRSDFPTLPEGPGEIDRRFLELNEIILKACQTNPAERYQTAEAMAADLTRVISGRSAQRLRLLERQWRMLSRWSLGLLATLLVAAGIFGIFQLYQKIPFNRLAWGAVGLVSVLLIISLFDKLRDSVRWLKALAKRKAAALPPPGTPKGGRERTTSIRPPAATPERTRAEPRATTGDITLLGRQRAPTAFFGDTEWKEIAAIDDRSLALERIERKLESHRSKFEAEYATLSRQALHTYRLWVGCAVIGFLALLAAMIAMLLGHLAQGIAVAALSTPVYFIMRILSQREDNYRTLVIEQSDRLHYNDELLLHVSKGERQTRLVGMIKQKVALRPEHAVRTATAGIAEEETTETTLLLTDRGTGRGGLMRQLDEGISKTMPATETGAQFDDVRFSGFAPQYVLPDTRFIVDIWAYLESQRKEVLERGARGGRLAEAGEIGPVPIERGVELNLHLDMPDFEVVRGQARLIWSGKPANATFIVRCGTAVNPGSHPCCVQIERQGVPMALLVFDLLVGERQQPERQIFDGRRIRNAFASYASPDRDNVLLWVSGARTFGVDVFVDVLNLRAGAHWDEELQAQLKTKDLFCLFWSKPASESKEVEKEWRTALKERGIYYIHPVPFADPRDVLPPEELRQCKHFNDLILRMYEYESERKRNKPE